MKYIRQFLIILLISFLGELIKMLLPLPIPASIYGMGLLFAGLMTGAVRLEQVKDTGKFLLDILPILFIPAGVGLMASWGVLKPVLLPALLIVVLSLILTFGVTGRVSQHFMKRGRKHE